MTGDNFTQPDGGHFVCRKRSTAADIND